MRIWIHGRSREDIRAMQSRYVGPGDTLAGVSVHDGGTFPLGGLAEPMQAAVRGALDELLVPDMALLGRAPGALLEVFRSYRVSVKSANSCGSSSSW